MKKIFASGVAAFLFSVTAAAAASQGEYIVKFKSHVAGARMQTVAGKTAGFKAFRARAGFARIRYNSANAIQELMANPDVEYVEPNFTVIIDPEEPVEEVASAAAPTQVDESWPVEKSVEEAGTVTVAVIDSGVDLSHPLFSQSQGIWENLKEKSGRAGVDDDKNGYVDDINGWNFVSDSGAVIDDNSHGTHVAGIVMSAGQNILTDNYERSKIKIMPLRFLNANGSGATSDAIQAIYYAVDNGASVINNSWGGSNYSNALREAYEYANSKGVLIVSAAGNYASNNDEFDMYPANYQTLNNISVMATYNDDVKAGFSNYGQKKVSVAAPGVAVTSSVPGTCDGGCYKRMSGTSMAAPFVAGVAAMMKRESPKSLPPAIKNIILEQADKVAGLKEMSVSGARINVLKAVLRAQAESYLDSEEPTGTVTPNSYSKSGGSGAGCGLVAAASKTLTRKEKQNKNINTFLLLAVLLLPLYLASALKNHRAVIRS
jgi:subtilisin family serine protease